MEETLPHLHRHFVRFCFRVREMQSSISRKSALPKKKHGPEFGCVLLPSVQSSQALFGGGIRGLGGVETRLHLSNPEISYTGKRNIYKNVRKLKSAGVKKAIQNGLEIWIGKDKRRLKLERINAVDNLTFWAKVMEHHQTPEAKKGGKPSLFFFLREIWRVQT